MNLIEIMFDLALLRPLFRDLASWNSWVVVFKAMFGLPMTTEELARFTHLSGRQTPPLSPVREAWWIFGRRAGKSFAASLLAVWLSCFVVYRHILGPGEKGVVQVVSVDRRQSRVIQRYISAMLNAVPMLADMIVRQDSESIELNNGIVIEITTASFRSIRGYTIVACICDEISFWRSEDSANPAAEVLAAVRPAMATVPGAMLVCLGTPYRRSGVMFNAWKKYYGQEDAEVLVLQADTRTMNPTVSQAIIDRAMEADPVAAQAEYYATFRSDVGSYVDTDLADQAVEPGCHERPPLPNVRHEVFIDVAEGVATTGDWIALGIAHRVPLPVPRSWREEQEHKLRPPRVCLDALRWVKPPFDPERILAEWVPLIKRYGAQEVVGDRVSQGWVGPSFARYGIRFKPSELTKSELYLRCLPLFTSGSLDLLDIPQLQTQLLSLERTTHRSGRDHVNHAPGGAHDDVVNAALGAAALCTMHVPSIKLVKLIGI